MRIALVCDRYGRGGGLELWSGQVLSLLARRGHEVHVLAFRVEGADGPARIHALPWRESRLARAAVAARTLDALAPDIAHDTGVGWRYDVLHPQTGSKLANREGDLASLGALARLRTRLGPALARWRREARALERRQYVEGRGLVIAVSNAIARDLANRWGLPATRARIVPNGIDAERYAPARCAPLRERSRATLGVGASVPVFLFIARNPRLKGLVPLLRATAILRNRGVEFRVVVVGSEPAPDFRRLAERLGVERVVAFAGPADDPLPHYAAADVFVLPTYYDACSLVVLEACACGLPVVTTRRNGAAELIAHGRDGFVLDEPDDTAALAALMQRAADADGRERLARAARDLALRHTIERNVDAIEAVYAEALARRGAATKAVA